MKMIFVIFLSIGVVAYLCGCANDGEGYDSSKKEESPKTINLFKHTF